MISPCHLCYRDERAILQTLRAQWSVMFSQCGRLLFSAPVRGCLMFWHAIRIISCIDLVHLLQTLNTPFRSAHLCQTASTTKTELPGRMVVVHWVGVQHTFCACWSYVSVLRVCACVMCTVVRQRGGSWCTAFLLRWLQLPPLVNLMLARNCVQIKLS